MSIKKRLALGVIFLGIIIAVRFSGLDTYLNLSFFKQHFAAFENYVHSHYLLSVGVFILLFTLIAAMAIPITPLLNVAAGALFSFLPATLYSVVAATAGAATAFFMVRYAFGHVLQKKYGDRLRTFNREFERRGYSYLLFLQLLPVTPYFLIVVLTGLSSISWITFVWTTAVGITPGTMIYVFAGRELAHIHKPSDILSPQVIIALLGLAVISLLPIVWRYIRKRFSTHI